MRYLSLFKKVIPPVVGLVLGLSFITAMGAVKVPQISDIKELKPEVRQETSCNRIFGYFTRSHYKETALDSLFANKVYDRYFATVDYTHSLFTADEIAKIKSDTASILSSMENCNLKYPYSLFEQVMKRRFERYSYYLEVLKQPMDFSKKESMALDHSKLENPKTEAELKQLWALSVKNDFLNLKLSGKTDDKIRELLRKRYQNVLRSIVQNKGEDAFSYFENAFASAIDPHTSYLSPSASSNFEDEMKLSMEGIGAVLTQADDYTQIVSLVPGSPAELSKKLKPKDLIIGVQQHSSSKDEMVDVVGMRLIDVVPLVKGPKGSKVTLEIQRGEGAGSTIFQVDLVRNKIRLEEGAAKGKVKTINGRKVGVLTVKSFYMNLSEDMKKEIVKMKDEGIEAMVVDLRSNGGGALNEATLSSGLFITKGPVVQVRDALGTVNLQSDYDGKSYYEGPVVVLIDRFSASSSEIFAAALQDWGRAIIVGDTSFGKGTVQQSRPLDRIYDFFENPLGSIHYTIAKFYRINGGSTQMKGVTPDIAFPVLYNHSIFGEQTEPNALEWDQIKPTIYTPYADLKALVPALASKHEQRVKNDEGFIYISNKSKNFEESYQKNEISLNYADRIEKKNKTDEQELSYINGYLASIGKPKVAKLTDLPDNFENPDSFLEEAGNIALDLADSLKK